MKREGRSVGAVVQQPLDSLFVSTFFTDIQTAGQDIVDLEGWEKCDRCIRQNENLFFIKQIATTFKMLLDCS